MIRLGELDARGDAVAIASSDEVWSFAELASRARELALRLSRAGVSRGDVVALALGRCPEHVCAILAAWHLGAAFLPIDPSAPRERVSACLREARARVVLSRDDRRVAVTELEPRPPLGDVDLAYVIFTSGSTGRPKGVRVSHRGLRLVLDEQVRAFGLAPGKRALLSLSLAFDASISDIGTALVSGATLVIPSVAPSPPELASALDVLGITHADLPPSVLPLVDPSKLPSTFETVIVGGEPASFAAVRAWSRHARMINVYGPTEATICTHLCECDASWSAPLLGRPLAHVQTMMDGEELLLGGPAIALGYVDRPELEAAKFVVREGARWYKTGDRVRARDDGSLEFLGRVDRQVKVRGQLVSPEEVESRLRELDGVASAAVALEGTSLVAFVAAASAPLDASVLRAELARALPEWMLPKIILANELPRGSTGKVDLSAIDGRRANVIARAMGEALGVVASVADDFFELGGHSLAALEVSARAALEGVSVRPDAILRARTPRAIATFEPEVPTMRELSLRAARASSELSANEALGWGEDLLITGATGFLGSRVLARLVDRSQARVHVLVRAPSDEQAAARVPRHERVTAWAGDVTLPRFGLDVARWRRLSESVGRVVHSAAAVNLALPLESLAPVNVRGALEVARFARTGREKIVTHVSSLAVLVQTDDASTLIDESTTASPDARVFGGYAQSKVMAEAILSECGALVVRPGLLTGDSRTGLGARACQLAWFLRSLARVGCVPEGDHALLRVDVTPVDHAALVVADLALSTHGREIVHVSSSRGASLEDLLRALRVHARIDAVPMEVWLQRAREALPADSAMALLAMSHRLLGDERHREVDLFLLTGRELDSRRATALTEHACPVADASLLDRYVRAALSEGS